VRAISDLSARKAASARVGFPKRRRAVPGERANPMSVVATAEERTTPSRVARRTTPAAVLAALGIVYGDLGTSPLYTLQTVIQTIGGQFTPEAATGVLSLILWALVITISVKYCLFVMRADNHGEGGILALMPLAGVAAFDRGRALVVMGLFGAALIYEIQLLHAGLQPKPQECFRRQKRDVLAGGAIHFTRSPRPRSSIRAA
jgi:hypothetical protein